MERGKRVIRWFDKVTEWCAGDAELHAVDAPFLRRFFGVRENDPMYGCFPVSAHEASVLQKYTDHTIDLDRYDYFVEYDAPPLKAPLPRPAGRAAR